MKTHFEVNIDPANLPAVVAVLNTNSFRIEYHYLDKDRQRNIHLKIDKRTALNEILIHDLERKKILMEGIFIIIIYK